MGDYRLVVTKKSGYEMYIQFNGAADDDDLDILSAMRHGLEEYGYVATVEQRTTKWCRVT